MKMVLIIPGGNDKISFLAGIIEDKLKKSGIEILKKDIKSPDSESGNTALLFSNVSLVVIGSPTLSWSGNISEDTCHFIDSCSALEGRKVAVFTDKKMIGSDKALRNLMNAVEKRGSFLFDFETISGRNEAEAYANRLLSVENSLGKRS